MKKYPDCHFDEGGNCYACSLCSYGRDCHNVPLADAASLVSTTEYAAMHGRDPATVRQLLKRGSLHTAVRIGRNWFIDRNEPYPDRRVTSGAYVDWRKPKE